MSNALAPQQATGSLRPAGQFDLSPQTFEQAMSFSKMLADSDLVPKDFKGKPGNCMIAMQWGSELGLKPLQALSNIAVVNGRAALWGDAVIALVRGSPVCEYVKETDDGHTATCRAKRKGEAEHVVTFSMDDAKQAGLAGKQGPWSQYPKRMRQMRARAFALRDVFPDVLRGMPIAEEVQDIPTERHMGQATDVTPEPPAEPAAYPQADFDKNMPAWAKAIAAGKKSMDAVISTVEAKAPLTEEQKAALADEVKKLEPQDVVSKTTTGAPPVDAATLEKRLREAPDLDQLYEAAGLMDAITDTEIRADLDQVFNERLHELGG
ncbi:recombinase RecT [Comamonas sp. UBA7528]|uniref:recombinase RecT n=1 Tax=Comamonas sp. UBA7528 TaxID=1946391 RepID=UPI0025C1792F|nr:recombinase RecT [Comamonas sp. UBA7528]